MTENCNQLFFVEERRKKVLESWFGFLVCLWSVLKIRMFFEPISYLKKYYFTTWKSVWIKLFNNIFRLVNDIRTQIFKTIISSSAFNLSVAKPKNRHFSQLLLHFFCILKLFLGNNQNLFISDLKLETPKCCCWCYNGNRYRVNNFQI